MPISARHLTRLVASLLLSGCATLVPPPTCVHRNADVEKRIGYCQAVRVGNTLHVSGIAVAGPMEAAIPKVYDALRATLAANGLTFADVVKETVYATDLDAFIAGSETRKAFYAGNLPAATWVQVARLFRPNMILEVELVAQYRG